MTYYISPEITPWQRQIILGTVLGGSSIVRPQGGRNSYLSMRGKDAYWLEYKSHELKSLASPTPFLIENANKYFRWHSLCYPIFNDFHSLFYQDGKKKVEMSTLNELRDIGLAVWFLDNGRIERNCVILTTTGFGLDGTNLICQYFNEIGVESKIKKKGTSDRVVMNQKGSEKFLKTIAGQVPEFMLYRLAGE